MENIFLLEIFMLIFCHQAIFLGEIMKKWIITFVLSSVTCISYGAVIPLINTNNCTDLAKQVEPPTVCTEYNLAAPGTKINQGDTFSITCTFSAGLNNIHGIPGDVQATVTSPVEITSGPEIPANQWTSLPTHGASIVKFNWAGIANESLRNGDSFQISFAASNLTWNQTVKVSCVNDQ